MKLKLVFCQHVLAKKKYETFTFESGNEMKLAPVFHKFPEY